MKTRLQSRRPGGIMMLAAAGLTGAVWAADARLPEDFLGRSFPELAYPDDWTPAEVMLNEYQAIHIEDPDADIRFRVEVHASKLGRSPEAMGLPVLRSSESPDSPDEIVDMLVNIPFLPSEFVVNDQLDTDGFEAHVNRALAMLTVDDAKSIDGHTCGRMIDGTLITMSIRNTRLELDEQQPTNSEIHLSYRCDPEGWRMAGFGRKMLETLEGP